MFHGYSLVDMDVLNKYDISIQIAACSFDLHLLEISHSLMFGATIVMLRPDSLMDINAVVNTIHKHAVTFALFTPSYTIAVQTYCETITENASLLSTLRNLCNAGNKRYI